MCERGREGERRKGRAGGVLARLAVALLSPILPLALSQTGCAYYSFSGAALPDHLRTVAVPLVEDRAAGSVPDLDRALTDALVARFAERTRLRLEPDEEAADAVLRAAIARYALEPVAVTGLEQAALNRLTVVVDVTFLDRVQDRERLTRTFRASADYDPALGPSAEAEAAARAVEQLADDVFTAATSDW